MTPRLGRAFRPSLLELERRDVPAWWSVTAPMPPEGTAGDSDATHTGVLVPNPEFAIVDGAVRVSAATAVEATAKALVGTITVSLGGQTSDVMFGPDTVGAVADHKAFAVAVNGSTVSVSLEDMAGFPGAAPDWDYDDGSWSGVTVAGAANGGVQTMVGTAAWGNHTATVTTTVTKGTDAYPESYVWNYHVHNNNFDIPNNELPGIGFVGVLTLAADATVSLGNTAGWSGTNDVVYSGIDNAVYWSGLPSLMPSHSADFYFNTPPLPIVPGGVEVWEPTFATGAVAVALVPAVPTADITIDGKIQVGDMRPNKGGVETVFTQQNEDATLGGLVIRNVDKNNAPRQQITVHKLKAGGQEVEGGKVNFSWDGKVDIYDKKIDGVRMKSGEPLDNANLPKTFWVQGKTGSTTMRDVKITAKPVGAVGDAGMDEVSFTVLWVDVTVAFAGKISANNDKLQLKKSVTFDAAGKNTDALGIYTTVAGGETRIGWSLEGRGLVHPSDFSYSGSDLSLRRVWDSKAYITPPAGAGQAFVVQTGGFTEDTSLPEWRDDNPLDSGGYIYDLDFPGLATSNPGLNQAQGTVARYRANFKEAAAITINGNNTRASGLYLYYVRFSLVQTGAGITNKWAVIDPPDIAGDKQASGPAQTKLSADLS